MLVLLGSPNWLVRTVARSLESPLRSLDMEIYRTEDGRVIIFIPFCVFYLTFTLPG